MARDTWFETLNSNLMFARTTKYLHKITYNSLKASYRKPSKGVGNKLTFWLVLPFHRGFAYSMIKRALSEAVAPWQRTLPFLLGQQPSFQLSLKNGHANLERALLKL